ncbi:MAG TPA: DUF72 domain-containing protein [Flavisolibacter sp.]|jgi:uncharacterized protein YecE (DUF72 family)|nr:DUF72 domain-containing protein [Flavisolibacter sp.]
MEAIRWHIGCSGFHYKEWKEIFYPKGLPATRWFTYYASQFDTLEINNTFYRFPELKLFENWYQRSPAPFMFAVKVPGIITHEKQFVETEELMRDFYLVAQEGLKEKLGAILFQLPPKFQFSMNRLQDILRQIDIRFNNVIEFRHISWWRKEVAEALREYNVSFCGVSFPGLINDAIINSSHCYYRFHGVPKLYHSPYDKDFLKKIVEQIRAAQPDTAYLYFNNTASGAAIENARQVLELIS